MGTILIVDDDEEKGRNREDALREAGHAVFRTCEDNVAQFFTVVQEALARKFWDVLILDIRFPNNRFGGIELYNRLARGELRAQWDHTIVCTLFTGGKVQNATQGEELVVRVFVQTAGIPWDCVVGPLIGGYRSIVQKVDELLGFGRLPRCPSCGRPK